MLCLLMTFVSFTATALGQRTTIKLDNVELQVAFNEIKQKMGYTFVYNDQVVKNVGKISVNVTSSDIRQILAKCLEGTSLDFYIEDNIVVIMAKTEQSVRETEKKPVTVKGKVVDEKRQALPGVTVLIKGTTLGVQPGLRVIFRSWSPTRRMPNWCSRLSGWYLKQFLIRASRKESGPLF